MSTDADDCNCEQALRLREQLCECEAEIAAAASTERAAIVAWLRAARQTRVHTTPLADRIEAGEHLAAGTGGEKGEYLPPDDYDNTDPLDRTDSGER